MKVDFYRHSLDDRDRQAALEVMGSVFLSAGPVSVAFEEKFGKFTGLPYVVGVNSGTAALHLAMMALDIGPGDEVITTPMTFIASINCILYVGASPVLVDVEPATGLLDAQQVEQKINTRTKAILPVHMYGAMADMRALRELADKHKLFIVEDCAHCIEAARDHIRPGQLSDIACFSFYATKNLTCGEGGAIATAHENVASRIRSLRQHGMSRAAANRFSSGAYQHWDMVELGYKYNPNDILSALMLYQLDRLHDLHKQREQLARNYDQLLSGVENLNQPEVKGQSAWHLYTVWVAENIRDQVIEELNQAGIGVTVNYRAVHNLTFYKEKFAFQPQDFPQANRIGNSTISLPFYPGLTPEEQEYVAASLKKILKKLSVKF